MNSKVKMGYVFLIILFVTIFASGFLTGTKHAKVEYVEIAWSERRWLPLEVKKMVQEGNSGQCLTSYAIIWEASTSTKEEYCSTNQ